MASERYIVAGERYIVASERYVVASEGVLWLVKGRLRPQELPTQYEGRGSLPTFDTWSALHAPLDGIWARLSYEEQPSTQALSLSDLSPATTRGCACSAHFVATVSLLSSPMGGPPSQRWVTDAAWSGCPSSGIWKGWATQI